MRHVIRFLALAGLLPLPVFGQNIVTPVAVYKDGDATALGYSGTEKDLFVDGGSRQSIVWIVFRSKGLDVSKITSAELVLYVKAVTSRHPARAGPDV
jgi:hypothetical protein